MRTARLALGALLAAVVLAAGCDYVAAAVLFFSPPRIQKAEFKLSQRRVALLIETARPEEENAVFRQALHDKLVEILHDNKVNTQLVPQAELLGLRQRNPDFKSWSIQKIGRRLNAEQVLWLRIDRLQMREAPDSPLLAPGARLRMKVIGTDAAEGSARLWPGSQEAEGRVLQRARPPHEAAGPLVLDEEATKLGKDCAWLVAMPFYDVDLEKKTPWEP